LNRSNLYIVAQTEMIYVASPDFDTLIDQLRELNGRMVMYGEERDFSEVLKLAREQVEIMEGDEPQTEVSYYLDTSLHAGSGNSRMRYLVQFIRRMDAIIFHRIRIIKQSHE
jgi:hypothetical protein